MTEQIRITALKADGKAYRWWDAYVEERSPEQMVVMTPPGQWLYQTAGDIQGRHYLRTFYWPDRWYNLVEMYFADGSPRMLYIHIASPAVFTPQGIEYCDYELDVLQYVGEPAKVVDEDEFEEAARLYGYTPEFQAQCRRAVAEALDLIGRWEWKGFVPR